jgi:predicted amidophosphoribosyltransferase
VNGNLPPGLTEAHIYFNPPLCPHCREAATEGEDCPTCGKYVPDPQEVEDEAAEREADAVRDELDEESYGGP